MISGSDPFSLENCAGLLSQLVEIDTCQPAGNEARIVDLIEARYKNTRVVCTRLEHGNNRASLVVNLPGKLKTGSLAFVGHIDTVACGDQSLWASAPLAATVKAGTLFSRGSADMKGGVTAMLLALDHFIANNINLERDVYFCFTADEEKDGMGARALIESGLLQDAGNIIVAEPSQDAVGLCEKGALWVRVSANGVSCHASRPELGVNALEALMTFAAKARGLLNLAQEHKYLGKNSLSVTNFHGGIMTNIIPASASMEMDIRTLPTVSHDELLAQLATLCRELEAEMQPLSLNLEVINNRPPLEIEETDDLVIKILACAQNQGMALSKRGLSFYTDASQLVPALGLPFVILGPGDDREAHKTNEHIELSSVARFARLYSEIIKKLCL